MEPTPESDAPIDLRRWWTGEPDVDDAASQPDDDLTFAAQDLGRGRPAAPVEDGEELGFAQVPRPEADPGAAGDQDGSFVAGGRDAAAPETSSVAPAPSDSPASTLAPSDSPASGTPSDSPASGTAPSDSPSSAAAPAPRPGFVIRDAQDAFPSAPVDALVVGAPVTTHAPADDEDPEEVAPPPPFRITTSSTAAAAAQSAEPPWLLRDPSPEPAAASRRGWGTRQSGEVQRSASATLLQLREEAVHRSWKAAWIAVTAADPKLSRRREV